MVVRHAGRQRTRRRRRHARTTSPRSTASPAGCSPSPRPASDATTGTLVALANGQDSLVKDIQDRIDAWDLRLAKRKETLTRQFTAMETALSSLKNQSTWLAGQINSLPSSSS